MIEYEDDSEEVSVEATTSMNTIKPTPSSSSRLTKTKKSISERLVIQ